MGARLTKSDYEGWVSRTLHHYLIERDPGLRYEGKIRVEDIRLDTSAPEHMLEILFRDDARPRCLFGWRFPATEADSEAPEGVEHPDPWEKGLRGPEQAEVWAGTIILTNFEEHIEAAGLGLPSECESEGITWIGRYKP
jgi:hypothetical protein